MRCVALALALASVASAADLEALAKRLASGTMEERRGALAEVAQDGSVDAVRLALTQAGDPTLREAVVEALVAMPGTAGIEWLFGTGIAFPDTDMRAASVLALGRSALRLKRTLPRPVIERATDEDAAVRAAVAEVLGESKDANQLEPLWGLVVDRSWEVRLAAARALSQIEVPEAAAAQSAVEDPFLVVTAYEADLTVRREGVALLAASALPDAVAVDATSDDDPRIRALAAMVLARRRCDVDAAERLRVETDPAVLSAVAAWQARVRGPAGLIDALAAREEADLRLQLAWRCVLRDEAQAGRLVEIASKEPDARVRDGIRSAVLRGGFGALLAGDLAPPTALARDLPRILARRGHAQQGPEAASVRAACGWLARYQEADGRWSCAKNNPWTGGIPLPDFVEEDRYVDAAVTALSVLVFLGEGGPLDAELDGVWRRGVDYLLRCQSPDGRIDSAPPWAPSLTGRPSRYDPNPHPSNASNYNHTIGALALAEAFAMTGEERLRDPANRAIAWLFSVAPGGDLPWGGSLRAEDAAPSIFAIQALVVGRDAGLDVDPSCLDLARDYTEALLDPATGRPRYQHVMPYCLGGYDGAATLLSARAFLGMPLDARASMAAFDFIQPHRPNWNAHFDVPRSRPRSPADRWRNDDDILNLWFFRFATIAHLARGGDGWDRWRGELSATLLPMQRVDGDDEGSWDPEGAWSRVGGRVYSTAFAALALQAPYAYDLTPK